MYKLLNQFKALSAGKKIFLIAAIILIVLFVSPLAVKAATDGEVEIYAMVAELFARVESLEAENEGLRTEVDSLKGQLEQASLSSEDGGQTAEMGTLSEPVNPVNEPVQTTSEPEPEPEPPPPPPNPYANCSLSGVHVCTIDGVCHFGKWKIKIDDPGEADINNFFTDNGDNHLLYGQGQRPYGRVLD